MAPSWRFCFPTFRHQLSLDMTLSVYEKLTLSTDDVIISGYGLVLGDIFGERVVEVWSSGKCLVNTIAIRRVGLSREDLKPSLGLWRYKHSSALTE